MRAFEAAGIGSFQMIDWRPGLSELFDDNKEIISFKNIDDLKMKINYWLPREEERKEIAKYGKRRAYKNHTYSQRLSLLVSTIAGADSGYEIPAKLLNTYN